VTQAMQSEVLKGHADLLLLAALEGGPAHGYAIVEAVRSRSGGAFELAEGTVYPALYRLERRGLVSSEWVEGDGARKRRVYRLTQKGRKELGERRETWSDYVRAMQAALA
jgi:PadR family transcriptional regulator